ncbi:MAG: TlpA family protein disulfide reductase [Bryobacterales bacterium]|nr:TlpA family protein disulfide reductase [Bryobacterales bacterium]
MRTAVLAFLLGTSSLSAALVSDVRELIGKDDFAGAEALIRKHIGSSGKTPEAILAFSWLGRGAVGLKRYDKALAYAETTRADCLSALRTRKLDDEPQLPTALGASIEVHAQALSGKGARSEGVSFLKAELKRWHGTSMRTRIQKNIHLLSLVGTRPPALETAEYFGPRPPSFAQLKGKAVLLFFWAHWCADCKYQGPILAQLRDKYASKGLVLLAPTQYYGYVAGGEEAPAAKERPYIDQVRRQHYAGLVDVSAPLSQENFRIYGASTTPTLVLLDRNGLVAMYHPGRMTYEELANEIDRVLGQKATD